MKHVVLIGYSGHAFVVADILSMNDIAIKGYFERIEKEFNPFNLKFLGDESNTEVVHEAMKGADAYALAIGNNAIRRMVDTALRELGYRAETVIHQSSMISKHAVVGEGALVAAGVKISALASIGRGAIINTSAVIEHESQIGAYAHVAPGAIVTGNVKVGEGAFIGANATLKPGIVVGNNAVIGAGAVVLKNIPDAQVWAGCPARRIK